MKINIDTCHHSYYPRIARYLATKLDISYDLEKHLADYGRSMVSYKNWIDKVRLSNFY
jgi:hypothetical protein